MKGLKNSMINSFFTFVLIIFSTIMLPLQAAWSPPMQISPGPSSTNPNGTPLVINSNSIALVGWLNGSIGVAETLSSSDLLPQSSTWSAPQLIYSNSIPGVFPSFPSLSQDIYGGSIAAFGVIDPNNGIITLNASRRTAGIEVWPAPISLTLNGIPNAASLAIGNMGNFITLFALTSTGTPPYDITLLQLPANSNSWFPPIVLAQDNSTQPAVAAKTHLGLSTLAWKVDTPTLQIQASRFNFFNQQLSSTMNVPLPPLTTDILYMDIAVDDFGDAILIYDVQIGAQTQLYASTLLAGQNNWSEPLLISDPANDIVGASIASDASGNTTILWGEAVTPTQQFMRAATLPLSGTPIFITDLTDRNSLNTTVDASSKVVMDSFGNAAATWGVTMSGAESIQVSSKQVGQNWLTPETLSSTGSFPLIALSNQGTSVATWIDSVTSILMGSRNLFLFTLEQPSNFVGTIVKNEFLTETAYFLQMHWSPSLVPNILSYEIYNDNMLIGTISGNGPFSFLAPLNSKHIKGTYTLVSIASNGNRSLPLAITIQK